MGPLFFFPVWLHIIKKKNPLSLLFTNTCVIGTSRLVASLACLGCKALNQLVEKVLAESPET